MRGPANSVSGWRARSWRSIGPPPTTIRRASGRRARIAANAVKPTAEVLAAARGFREMTLHARESVVGFYERLGYAAEGSPFIEVTIPHRAMRKTLEAPTESG